MQRIEIRVNWSDWIGGLPIAHTESGQTVLAGWVRDQTALHGLLSRLADLGLPLVSVDARATSAARSEEGPQM